MSDYNKLNKGYKRKSNWQKCQLCVDGKLRWFSYFTGSEHKQYIDSHGDGLPMYELMNFYNGSWHTVMEYVTSR